MIPSALDKLLRTLPPALLLLLVWGLQSAFGCQPLPESTQNTGQNITSCHLDYRAEATASCCTNTACHRSATPLRHFGNPEILNQIKDVLPLIVELRQTMPQSRTGLAFDYRQLRKQPEPMAVSVSSTPRHSYRALRSTVLLH